MRFRGFCPYIALSVSFAASSPKGRAKFTPSVSLALDSIPIPSVPAGHLPLIRGVGPPEGGAEFLTLLVGA